MFPSKEALDFSSLEVVRGFDPSSHSFQLIARLSRRLVSPREMVTQLQGEKIEILCPPIKHSVRYIKGAVLTVSDWDLRLNPISTHQYYHSTEREIVRVPRNPKPRMVKGYFITDNLYGEMIDDKDPSLKWALHNYLPTRISVENGSGPEISFGANDPTLDLMVETALQNNQPVKNLNDLADLTNWINSKIPYKKHRMEGYSGHYRLPVIGEDIATLGSVCRQIAGLAFAVLETQGIVCTPVRCYSERYKDAHLYIRLDSGLNEIAEPVFCDPTGNISGTYSSLIRQLRSRGLTTDYHLKGNTKDLMLKPDWGVEG